MIAATMTGRWHAVGEETVPGRPGSAYSALVHAERQFAAASGRLVTAADRAAADRAAAAWLPGEPDVSLAGHWSRP
jgi:hypothetical protein